MPSTAQIIQSLKRKRFQPPNGGPVEHLAWINKAEEPHDHPHFGRFGIRSYSYEDSHPESSYGSHQGGGGIGSKSNSDGGSKGNSPAAKPKNVITAAPAKPPIAQVTKPAIAAPAPSAASYFGDIPAAVAAAVKAPVKAAPAPAAPGSYFNDITPPSNASYFNDIPQPKVNLGGNNAGYYGDLHSAVQKMAAAPKAKAITASKDTGYYGDLGGKPAEASYLSKPPQSPPGGSYYDDLKAPQPQPKSYFGDLAPDPRAEIENLFAKYQAPHKGQGLSGGWGMTAFENTPPGQTAETYPGAQTPSDAQLSNPATPQPTSPAKIAAIQTDTIKNIAAKYHMTPEQADQMVRTIMAESAGEPVLGQQAVANTMINRMLLGTSPKNVLTAYDGNGISGKIAATAPYKATVPGTDAYTQAISDFMRPASSYSEFSTLPASIKGATHFYNPDVVTPSWSNKNFTPLGHHNFGNPTIETQPEAMMAMREATGIGAKGAPASSSMFASINPSVAPPAPQQGKPSGFNLADYIPKSVKKGAAEFSNGMKKVNTFGPKTSVALAKMFMGDGQPAPDLHELQQTNGGGGTQSIHIPQKSVQPLTDPLTGKPVQRYRRKARPNPIMNGVHAYA